MRIVVVLAVLALTSFATAQPLPVNSVRVAYRDVDRRAFAEGVVEAVRQSALAAQIAGRIVALPVKAGDRVTAGQLLVQIDARTATQAVAASQSQVREAKANLANAKARYERSKQLVAQKFISQAALDQAQADYLAAEAQVAAASANASASAASQTFTSIVAPYDGIVAATDAQIGDMATIGRPLVTVFDPRALRVTATVPQAVLARADLSAPVEIHVPSLARSIVARRVTVVPVADVRTHTAQVRLDLPDAPGLMPGHYARASIVTGRAKALTIPERAVLRRSEVTAVYVLDAAGRAQLRQVRVGESVGDDAVEILTGLSAGELVSTEPVRTGIEAS
jgi:RND family efflux transporter MFP subunit